MYKIIIVPSSEDESKFDEEAHTFEKAEKLMNKGSNSASMFEFETELERNAFIQGYEAAIGWLGNGLFYVNNE